MVTINPKSVTLDELYGAFDSNTEEWTDGLLSSTIRRFAHSNSENRQGHSLPSSPSKTKSEEFMTKGEIYKHYISQVLSILLCLLLQTKGNV